MRLRKRAQLEEESKYREKKYDHLFIASLMSDDEDQFDDQKKKTGCYLSRAPMYRAEIVSFQYLLYAIISRAHAM